MSSLLEIEKRVEQLEGKFNHIYIRSEITLFIISAMISAGVIKKEGVVELVQNVNLDGFKAPAISEQERKNVLSILDKVTVTQ